MLNSLVSPSPERQLAGCEAAPSYAGRNARKSKSEMSVRFAPAPYEPIDAVGNPKKRESGASNGARRTADATVAAI